MQADMTYARERSRLRSLVSARLSSEGERWLADALAQVSEQATAIRTLFPAAGRRCGRDALDDVAGPGAPDIRESADIAGTRGGPGVAYRLDDAVRTLLLDALPLTGEALQAELESLYRYGDAAEKRGVLRGLHLVDGVSGQLGASQLPVVHDALRSNDPRLIAAALGPYGAHWLDAAAYRQGVLKCVFVGIPLSSVSKVDDRGDAELARMLVDYAHERVAAGRDVPADVWQVACRYPEIIDASGLPGEKGSAVPARRQAAQRALAERAERQRSVTPREQEG